MYEPIKDEFVEEVNSDQNGLEYSMSLERDEDRNYFANKLLSDFLGPEKLKEKDALACRLKYKRQQIEGSLKTVKKENNKKKGKTRICHKKKIVLTSKLKKSLNLYKIDKNEKLEYKNYEKMNDSWKAYAASCLLTCLPKNASMDQGGIKEENVLNCLKQIDYHGCLLTVLRSTSKSLIGLTGIVLQDKKNVFFVLCNDDKIKIIPKFGNLFEFEIFGCKFTLVGSNMCYKPEMRTTKHAKIKTKKNIQ
ncbi:Ribonuclease P subunit p29 [Brachionus plicatilis]|uniref:Ribonuclease P protein subunit p29 n=1 Tax=Brachionus plicatilis TaxID=10195 RepID=A0A3M7QGI9_BRAPC|nr:Ribonuclease P subunit p29 [Brachionus plicatilis]